jgi:DNA-binding transcriptional MerR regulator
VTIVEEVGIGEFARRSRLSVKALRLYDELGVLVPARVDGISGYRYYDLTQLDQARLIAMLRQLDMPLTAVRELLICNPRVAADRVAGFWREAEATHLLRRDLANHLVERLTGERTTIMYEVATREIPERSLLCLKRNVDEQAAWALGKEFIAILQDRPLPRLAGREGAVFCIYWAEVSADSDGPVEWCRPIPPTQAGTLASQYPELSLRTEPAHREAFVALPTGLADSPTSMQLASEALQAWAAQQGIDPRRLAFAPEDLGVRITYLPSPPDAAEKFPDRDFAVPFA